VWVEATGVRYRHADGSLRLIGVAQDIEARRKAESTQRALEEQLRRVARRRPIAVDSRKPCRQRSPKSPQ
jgi:hypothetical protein